MTELNCECASKDGRNRALTMSKAILGRYGERDREYAKRLGNVILLYCIRRGRRKGRD
jgi:hypothetical protein